MLGAEPHGSCKRTPTVGVLVLQVRFASFIHCVHLSTDNRVGLSVLHTFRFVNGTCHMHVAEYHVSMATVNRLLQLLP